MSCPRTNRIRSGSRRRKVVQRVLRIIEVDTPSIFDHGEIVFHIHIGRFDFVVRHVQEVARKLRLTSGVDVDGVNFGFLHRGNLVLLVKARDGDVVATEVFVGDADNIVLVDLCHPIKRRYRGIPVFKGEKGGGHCANAGEVGLESCFLSLFEVSDDGRNDPVFKFAVFDEVNLVE